MDHLSIGRKYSALVEKKYINGYLSANRQGEGGTRAIDNNNITINP